MPTFAPPVFAADQAGCPTCRLELVPHPAGGRFVCPRCRFERATLHERAHRGEHAASGRIGPESHDRNLEGAQPVDLVPEMSPPDISADISPETPAVGGETSGSDRPLATPSPDWISVIDLASRWGVSTYIATHRLREHAVPSLRDQGGKLVVDRADVERWPTEAPPAKKGGKGSGNGHSLEAAKPEPPPVERRDPPSAEPPAPAEPERPRGLLPSQEYQLAMKGSEARARRLRLALERVRHLAGGAGLDVNVAIYEVACYALEIDA